jgi:putative nucleotidyltransferase with HDIG domain
MASPFSALPQSCRRFVLTVSVIGQLIAGHSLFRLAAEPIDDQWYTLAVLTLLTGNFTVKIPGILARLSVSESFVFASVLMFGPAAGTITAVLDALIISLRLGHHTRDAFRVVFNVSVASLSAWVAAHFFFGLAGIQPYHIQHTPLGQILLPLVVFTATYFLLNSWLVTFAFALERNQRPFPIWHKNFLWLSLNYFGGASVAGLLVSYTRVIDFTTLGIIVPLLAISYLTFRTSLGRIQDAHQHVEEVNRLYLSTIETLAMAIDAKDQVTHGHIRRVQQFALGLAAELGVKDQGQLKALEAAALLHDTGKLVVPEHILNKPGRLTPGEFDKMKAHARVGAEILSAIQFPYPVVPIVRHHHECWDGNGYPDGLKGTDIPIGARILAVVDCFDALTSDRPYRRRLSDEEALAILVQRRGTMYDPLIVDTFAVINDRLIAAAGEKESEIEALLTSPGQPTSPPTQQSPLSFFWQASEVAKTAHAVLQSILAATGAKIAVFFIRDTKTDQLVTLTSTERDADSRHFFTIPVGSHVSGWVAANGRTIVNADAALDLPGHAASLGLSRCMCVPVSVGNEILAVIATYLDDPRGFSDHDLFTVEAAAGAVEPSQLRALVEQIAVKAKRDHAPTVH